MRNLFNRSHLILPPDLFAGSEEKARPGLNFFSKLFLAVVFLVACSESRALVSERGGRIPTVAVTAYAEVNTRQRALSAGFERHLAKPLDPAELISVVARLAGKPQEGPAAPS